MKEAIVILSEDINGGVGTLAIRIAIWCKANNLNLFYCIRKNDNDYNMKQLLLNSVIVSIDNDNRFMSQFQSIYNNQLRYRIIVHSLEHYYYAEIIQELYNNVDKIVFYQIGKNPMFGCYDDPNPKLKYIRLFLTRIINKNYFKNIYSSSSYYAMDLQCLRYMETMNNVRFDENKCILQLPFIFDTDFINKKLPDCFTISTISRMDFPFKAYVIGLINAYIIEKKHNPNMKLLIVGDGKDKKQVEAYIDSLTESDKNGITLIGTLPYNKLSSVFLQSSIFVGMGTTIIDAINCGTISIVAAMHSYDIKSKGLFLDYPNELGIEKDDGSFEEFIKCLHYVMEMKKDQYNSLANEQLSVAKRVFSMEVFMYNILNNSKPNYRIRDHVNKKMKYTIFLNIIEKARKWRYKFNRDCTK